MFSYCPETGIFRWKKQPGKRADLVGKIAGRNSHGYVMICLDYRHFGAHRLAWLYMTKEWPTHEIDHINGIRNDNRFCNLREATHKQNTWNQGPRKHSTSGIVGVAKDSQTGKWRAHITIDGKMRCLGRYETIEAAAEARKDAARRLYGDFAWSS